MSREIFVSHLSSVHHDDENQISEIRWFPTTADMTTEDYKEEALRHLKATQDNVTKAIFIDGRSYFYTIVPEVQEWIDEHIASGFVDAGARKMAVLFPESVFVQISAEQMFEEDNWAKMKQKYFDDEQAAFDWLKA